MQPNKSSKLSDLLAQKCGFSSQFLVPIDSPSWNNAFTQPGTCSALVLLVQAQLFAQVFEPKPRLVPLDQLWRQEPFEWISSIFVENLQKPFESLFPSEKESRIFLAKKRTSWKFINTSKSRIFFRRKNKKFSIFRVGSWNFYLSFSFSLPFSLSLPFAISFSLSLSLAR